MQTTCTRNRLNWNWIRFFELWLSVASRGLLAFTFNFLQTLTSIQLFLLKWECLTSWFRTDDLVCSSKPRIVSQWIISISTQNGGIFKGTGQSVCHVSSAPTARCHQEAWLAQVLPRESNLQDMATPKSRMDCRNVEHLPSRKEWNLKRLKKAREWQVWPPQCWNRAETFPELNILRHLTRTVPVVLLESGGRRRASTTPGALPLRLPTHSEHQQIQYKV